MLLTRSSRCATRATPTRGGRKGCSLWVVPSADDRRVAIPAEAGPLFEPAEDKVYRHPTFYDIPDEVKHI